MRFLGLFFSIIPKNAPRVKREHLEKTARFANARKKRTDLLEYATLLQKHPRGPLEFTYGTGKIGNNQQIPPRFVYVRKGDSLL